mmetsp:Transcript_66036/g.76706  ORF Transcript_66036/g.76706 Transcript_66036/m.76706 type:complete len:109 (-) Transcript_66036:71-397(-)
MPQEEIFGVEQFRDMVNADALSVVCFSAVWCGPCRNIQKDLEKMTYEFPEVQFLKVDADTNGDIVSKCRVSVLPTFMIVRQGQQLDYVVGADVNELKMKIRDRLSSSS